MSVSTRTSSPALTARASVAVGALTLSNWLSRTLGRGSGTVAGGRVGLAIDPSLLATLAHDRRIALVTGTNGKTTTTRLLAAALTSADGPAVASNATGANMPAGHVAALVGSTPSAPAVLEVDEGYLGRLVEETAPRVVVLLNLSRDQLDRISEVRMMVDRWRTALGRLTTGSPGTRVVANADDPMVAWAALAAPEVCWVGAGQVWRHDAVGCPSCGGRITFDRSGGWSCDRCPLGRPERHAWVEGASLVGADGSRHRLVLAIPGQFNRANAAMAAMAAPFMAEVPPSDPTGLASMVDGALDRMASVDQVAGRFSATVRRGRPVRLLLAKNPAGWTALFDLLDEDESEGGVRTPGGPVVLSVNARVADGLDTSWLWDVPFERLTHRTVVVTGDRRRDLAVRLRYAEVDCTVVADPLDAVDRAIDRAVDDAPSSPAAAVDFVGNYTAFADLRGRL